MQVRPQPALGFCQGHALALGIIFHLILLDLRHREVLAVGVEKYQPDTAAPGHMA